MYQMFERTNLCPYTDQCESFQTIIRAQSWMEQALARLRFNSFREPSSDSVNAIQTLQWKLAHSRVVKERCHSHIGRCLRFWQFKAKEEGELTLHRRRTALLRHEYHGEAEIEPLPE